MENTIRVNSARLGDFVGRDVRLVGKLKHLKVDHAIIESVDGGQVEVRIPSKTNLVDTYVEVVGSVIDSGTMKYKGCSNFGTELDMKLVNEATELMHDPRFKDAFM
ncbi:replication factor A protein 3 [Schizopora paradoxa]|uniref:Replication factor A protein 3 n=1 Tax=Schizopora paradoxa TaxID=27342 RepID=A0A0H2RE71_9AGAM|nr:replication factor A protein 3 [Schizopora paradoxa]